jgi:DNA invertase Pin-like site-specific DNA recombinase
MAYVRPGDALVVTELSRLATGRCFLSMMGAIHQMERELRAERAAAGRASAKARGKSGGRPRTDVTKLENAKILYEKTKRTAAEMCGIIGVGRRTFFTYLAEQRHTKQAS